MTESQWLRLAAAEAASQSDTGGWKKSDWTYQAIYRAAYAAAKRIGRYDDLGKSLVAAQKDATDIAAHAAGPEALAAYREVDAVAHGRGRTLLVDPDVARVGERYGAFLDAATNAVSAAVLRPYISAKDFAEMWRPYGAAIDFDTRPRGAWAGAADRNVAQAGRDGLEASRVRAEPWHADAVVDLQAIASRWFDEGHGLPDSVLIVPNPYFVLPLDALVKWEFATAVEVREATRWATSNTPPVRWQNPLFREKLNFMGWSDAEAYARVGLFYWQTDPLTPDPAVARLETKLRASGQIYDVPRPASLGRRPPQADALPDRLEPNGSAPDKPPGEPASPVANAGRQGLAADVAAVAADLALRQARGEMPPPNPESEVPYSQVAAQWIAARRPNGGARGAGAPAVPAGEAVPGATRTTATDAATAADTDASPDELLGRVRAGWPAIVAALSRTPLVRPLAEACRPLRLDGRVVVLGFPEDKAFLRQKAEQRHAAFEDAISTVVGTQLGIRCVATNLEALPPGDRTGAPRCAGETGARAAPSAPPSPATGSGGRVA
ncbi:MAG: hypothetical protein ACLQBX_13565 [Candidatus Limnocylindrales bacterium]